MDELVIRTSESGWLKTLSIAYKKHEAVMLIDDANIGINPQDDTLYRMGLKAKLSKAEIVGVCTALGMSAAGIAICCAAFFDPEPTTKILLIGAALLFSGGFTAIRILTKLKPPNVKYEGKGWTIEWT